MPADPSTFAGFAPLTRLRYNENETLPVIELTPDEPSAFNFAPVLTGADAALFEAEVVDGVVVVRFLAPPDFEAPADANSDNRFHVTVSRDYGAEGAVLGTATAQLVVRVVDLYEPLPIFLSNGAGDNLVVTYDNFTAVGSYTYTPRPMENATGVVLSVGVRSPDPTLGTPTLVMGGVDAALFTMDANGNVSFLVAPDFEDPTDANGDRTYQLTFTATAGVTHTAIANIQVRNVNETPPEVTSPLTATTPEVATGSGASGPLAYVPAANLGDANDASWAISGIDAARFVMDQHYNIFFRGAPDFEAPNDADGDGVYSITVTVSTDGGFSDSQAITVTLTNVNEAPVTASIAALTVSENAAGTVYSGVASDEDGDTLAWSLDGVDAALFAINSATGAVSFVTPADFERPTDDDGDNYYEFTVIASDGALSDQQAVRMRIVNAPDAPVITSATTATITENNTGLVYVATGTDDDRDAITFSLSGADAALFSLDGGLLRFVAGADFEAPADIDGNNVYELVITASDGGLSSSQALSITVTNVVEAPVVTSAASASFVENGLLPAYQATAFAESAEPVTWLLGGVDSALFGIDSLTGAVSFITPPDFETAVDAGGNNTYNITVFAGTPSGFVGERAIAITVTDIPDSPITGTNAADNITGTSGVDTILGLLGEDELRGRGGDDSLVGGDDNDLLNGGSGNDTMVGGLGDDTYRYDEIGDVMVEAEDEGYDTVRTSITLVLAEDSNIERVLLTGEEAIDATGTSFDNRIDGNIVANLLSGLDGADTLGGAGGADTLLGGDGDDSVAGGTGDDSLAAGAGDDRLRGGLGLDTLAGGAGDDLYYFDEAQDILVEAAGEGFDTVRTTVSLALAEDAEVEEVLLLGVLGLSATGNGFDNQLSGNEGANAIAGLGGADRLIGNGGADTLEGGAGDDTLSGSAGDDVLRGGLGADRLAGDAGADVFIYGGIAEGGDVISLFAPGSDDIHVSATGFFGVDVAAGDDLAALGRFQINATGLATGSLAQFIYDSATGRLWFDSNGDAGGGRQTVAVLLGAPELTAVDLVVIA